MAQPISQYNVIRPKKMDADVLPSVATTTTQPLANGGRVPINGVVNANTAKGVLSDPQATPEQIAAAQEAAAAGDQSAIDWLKAVGIGVAGYGIARALANRKGKVPPVAATVQAGPAKGATAVVPHVNKVYGEHLVDVIPPNAALPANAAGMRRIGTGTPAPVGSPAMRDALNAPGKFNAPGKTNQQKEMELSYAQKAIQDAKAARLKKPTAAKDRAYLLQEALRYARRR
jgi:hypothetical protein